jgi:hypothetical protein
VVVVVVEGLLSGETGETKESVATRGGSCDEQEPERERERESERESRRIRRSLQKAIRFLRALPLALSHNHDAPHNLIPWLPFSMPLSRPRFGIFTEYSRYFGIWTELHGYEVPGED